MDNATGSEDDQLERHVAELEAKEALWRKAEEEALRLNAMVQSANDAIIGKTTKGIVQTWNSGAERVYGYSAAEMLGRDMTVILPPGQSDEEGRILEQIGRGERVEHFDTVRMRKDGRIIHVSIAISPIRNKSGEVIGASHVARETPGTNASSVRMMAPTSSVTSRQSSRTVM
jgi:PAS domain S-box-containing protein